MKGKFKNWSERQMYIRTFFMLGSILLGLLVFCCVLRGVHDPDIYFMIASGKEWLSSGVIHQNVWCIDNECSIIIQQWLYNILTMWFNKWDFVGLFIFALIRLSLFFGLIWYFFSLRGTNKILRVLSITIIILLLEYPIFSVRPELITIMFLLAECICLEKYRITEKIGWTILLLPLMLLEINMHASMWPFHFAVLLAYITPALELPMIKKDDLSSKWKPLSVIALCMGGIMFINPYGVEGVTYIIKSFTAHTFKIIPVIGELQAPTFIDTTGLSIILLAMGLLGCMITKCAHSTTIYICFGFLLLSIFAIRNQMFLILGYLFMFRDLSDYLITVDYDWKQDIKNSLSIIMIIGIIIISGKDISLAQKILTHTLTNIESYAEYDEICNEILKDYSEDAHIFTGFNIGAYCEYRGLKNIYLDARPELYTKEFTGNHNILLEYSKYCICGCNPTNPEDVITNEDRTKWFDEYSFDYVIVHIPSEIALNTYMQTRTDYTLIEEVSTNEYALYKKGTGR
ncbi:MAG: hypothetical protein IIT65_00695 [Lachnospiraceae bacterium]|nr:hypothetical protein [Lachnospiraceae bacterium]